MADVRHRLSKSRFVAGVQCDKLLWWKVHEPDAVKLQPDNVLRDLFDQGKAVGALATTLFPDGLLIDLPHHAVEERISETRDALEAGAPAVFEASFLEHRTFVAVDILELVTEGYHLIEVKSSTSQKPEHIPDVAVQLNILAEAGINVTRTSVMHLNRDFRSPDLGERFCKTDVTTAAREFELGTAARIDAQLKMLDRPLPSVSIGAHCHDPRPCPFIKRCWPQERDHISRLYNVGPKTAAKYFEEGIHRISDIPPSKKLPGAARRQVRALSEGEMIIEPGLGEAPDALSGAVGFLDFETIARAIPPWPDLAPWGQAAAQFSYHQSESDGSYSHVGFLAEGPKDARPKLEGSDTLRSRSSLHCGRQRWVWPAANP